MAAIVYCSWNDVDYRLSEVGASLQTDDDTAFRMDVLDEASSIIDEHLYRHYTPEQLGGDPASVGGRWVKHACSLVAANIAFERRGNTPPRSLRRKYDKLMEKLEDIESGHKHVPGLERRRTSAPMLSQPRIRLDPVPHTVIERGRGSSRGHPQDYTQRKDVTENPADYTV